LNTVLKYPGSKWRIADWLISYIPAHHSYVEPYFGSGAVLFNKTPGAIETINDLEWDVCNLFHCIKKDSKKLASKYTNLKQITLEQRKRRYWLKE
jgi:DNA adenine methylase